MARRLNVTWIICLLLVFCSQAVLGAATAPAGREPVTLVLANYFNGTRVPLVDAQLKEFQQLYPWITVRNQVVGATASTIEKDLVAILGGMPPDVWMVDRISIPMYVEKGILQPLDDFMRQDNFNMNLFYKSEQQLYQYKGKTYALPMIASSVSLLYYNRTLLAQGGYAADGTPKTWQELLQMASRLQRVNSDGTVQVNGGDISYFPRYCFAQLAYANGSQMLQNPLDINYLNDTVREAANWAIEFVTRVPKGGSLTNGTRVFQLHGEWQFFTVVKQNPDLDLGLALMPHGPKGDSISLAAAGWSYGIPANVKHPYESWLLIKFLTTSESARTFALEQGRPSPIVKFNQDRRYFDQNPYWSVVGESLNRSVVAPPSPVASKVSDADRKYYAQLLTNKESSEAILQKLQGEVNTIIAEYKAGR